jgi:type I restriction-modification system DNA methylase subunit
MALKKSALYSSLWQSCDELRGGMDASQPEVKRYVVGGELHRMDEEKAPPRA